MFIQKNVSSYISAGLLVMNNLGYRNSLGRSEMQSSNQDAYREGKHVERERGNYFEGPGDFA